MITSRNNRRVVALAALQQKKKRAETGRALAEGERLCAEAFQSNARVRTLVLSESFRQRPLAADLRDMATSAGAEILEVSASCYQKISALRSPDGAAVEFRIKLPELSPLLEAPAARLVVMAGVQDPGNAGAVARVAEAAGATGCVFLDGVDVHNPKFLRATMGSCFRLPCATTNGTMFLKQARQAKIRIMAASVGGDKVMSYEDADYPPPLAVCLGGEGSGLPEEIVRAADNLIVIPMAGKVESLNVAVAAGIILYRARRDW